MATYPNKEFQDIYDGIIASMGTDDQLKANLEAALRPLYEQSLEQLQQRRRENNAAIDVDAASRGMGNSTWVTDAKLRKLNEDYTAVIDASEHRTLIVADRFPFRYLTEDYGLDYYAAFSGCEAETEASFATVIFLAGKADELGVKQLCVIETSDGKLARTVIENTKSRDLGVLMLHSMQGAVGEGDYLSLMEQNLNVLKEALN